jgi:hypothetical protein
MSNDARFWAFRLLFVGILCLDAFLFTSMVTQALKPDGNVVPWAIAISVSFIVSIPLGFMFHLARERRWEDSQRDMRQLEVEALAATAKQKGKDTKA